MDRRSWPWKKKSSDKNVAASEPSESSVGHLASHNDKQDVPKTLADQVRMSEDAMVQFHESEEKVKNLNEKLSAALSEISVKESIAKQHAKVAEEAVSGWEKAEAEAKVAKQQVESLKQQNVALEDRVTHLDGALKECMRQLRHVREEQEHKIQEVVLSKTRECDAIRFEFEAKIGALEQHLLKVGAENTALSRSLQERNKTLAEVNEARSQAEAEVKVFQVNIESYENEISSLKYEFHVLSKELEIRNEERNISMKSAEVANKQHLETVKKIAKLEAECQRLRGLVRKKLPGPAALAQMKMEVETLGKELGEGRRKKSPGKTPGLYSSASFDSVYDNSQDQSQKESEFLTERLLAMEEETKMLKEALAKRNSELQSSRMMCARTASKLNSVEKQLEALSQKPRKPATDLHVEGPRSQTTSNPPSLTSMSEDGNDDEISCAESWASALISELSQFKKEKESGRSDKTRELGNLDLMDDFAEMEKLASLPSPKIDQTIGKLDGLSEKGVVGLEDKTSLEATLAERDSELQSAKQQCLHLSNKLAFVQEQLTELQSKNVANENALGSLQAKLDTIFEAQADGGDLQKVLQDVKCAMAEADASRSQLHEQPFPPQFTKTSTIKEEGISLSETKVQIDVTDPKLESAFCKVVTLVESIGNEARSSQILPDSKMHDLDTSIEKFTEYINQIIHGKMDIVEFVTELSSVLIQISEISVSAFGKHDVQNAANESDCITPEIDNSNQFENGSCETHLFKKETNSSMPSMSSYTTSPNADSELNIIKVDKTALESELKVKVARCETLEEELAQVKAEKAELENELVASKQKLSQMKDRLVEADDMLKNLRQQLASTEESKQLAENELEIMTSSKADLELQLKSAEVETSDLHDKVETLESELKEERKQYGDTEAKCQDLQEQLHRKDVELACLQSSISDNDSKMRQEREIAAAAEKLAECQQTILVLGRQLKALSSPKDSIDWSSETENVLPTFSTSGPGPQKTSQSTKDSRHPIEDVISFTCQSSERNEQAASLSPNSHCASRASEPDIPVAVNGKNKTSRQSSVSSGMNAHDIDKNNESNSPIHEDYADRHLTMPSSSDTEPSSPGRSPVKPTHQKNNVPRSIAGNALSKSLNAVDGKSSSSVSSTEKHGSVVSRFFSRTRNSR